MELEEDKKRLADLSEITAKRREERESKFSKTKKKKDEGKAFGDSLKGAEKYKSMVKPNNISYLHRSG